MRLKGIKQVRQKDGSYVVTPLYFSKRGGAQTLSHLSQEGPSLLEAWGKLQVVLIERGDLKGSE